MRQKQIKIERKMVIFRAYIYKRSTKEQSISGALIEKIFSRKDIHVRNPSAYYLFPKKSGMEVADWPDTHDRDTI